MWYRHGIIRNCVNLTRVLPPKTGGLDGDVLIRTAIPENCKPIRRGMSTCGSRNYYREMSSSAKETSAIRATQAPRSVRLVNWPLRDGGLRAWGMLFCLGLLAAGAGFVAQSGVMGGGCFAALSMAAWRLWVPVTFEFRSRGVIYSAFGRSRHIPWTQIARYEARPRGLLLFAEDDRSTLAALRSIYVLWNGQRAAIMEVVAFYTAARVSVASTKTFLDKTIENREP